MIRCFLLCLLAVLGAEETLPIAGIQVDLREPYYADGCITTTQGGVIQSPEIRIQARELRYTRKDGQSKLEAEQDLLIEYNHYFFVGERLEYDFIEKKGVIYCGRTGIEPWFFGGEIIFLNPDGSYNIFDGYITTSENSETDWQIVVEDAEIIDNKYLTAHNVRFFFVKLPVFWIPRFKTNLQSMLDAPIRYSFGWGGSQGPRAGMAIEIYATDYLRTYFRFDYRLNRGPGIGLETYYQAENESLEMINYVARDDSLSNPHENIRYRFQGVYKNSLWDETLTCDLTWDKLSDIDMPSDYNDRQLELDTAGRTELLVRSEYPAWITNFTTRLRVNQFQTVKQQMPTLQTNWLPLPLGTTGVIAESAISLGFLDFKYANGLENVHDYSSIRLEGREVLYRPFHYETWVFTPEAGIDAIFYGNSPQKREEMLWVGNLGWTLNTDLHRFYTPCIKHVMEPFLQYQYITSPTVNNHDHYIFDITDGWARVNRLRFGVNNDLFVKRDGECIRRWLSANLYADLFINSPTIEGQIPRAYLDFRFLTFPTLRHTVETAWNFSHNELDYLNFINQWTINEDCALSLEYRHRNQYTWRKVDPTNYILDSFRSEKQLLHSSVSDRRDTLLAHFFYRFHPNWALELEAVSGWNRRFEPTYNEFEIDLLANISAAWKVKISYQHKQDDDRVALYFNVGINRPTPCDQRVPCLDF